MGQHGGALTAMIASAGQRSPSLQMKSYAVQVRYYITCRAGASSHITGYCNAIEPRCKPPNHLHGGSQIVLWIQSQSDVNPACNDV